MLTRHSYYSLRYGTLSLEGLLDLLKTYGYETAVLCDFNNSTGCLEFIKLCQDRNFHGVIGMEYRRGDTWLYTGFAKNIEGFKELNDLMTRANLTASPLPEAPPEFTHAYVIYPFDSHPQELKDNEFIGVRMAMSTSYSACLQSNRFSRFSHYRTDTFFTRNNSPHSFYFTLFCPLANNIYCVISMGKITGI